MKHPVPSITATMEEMPEWHTWAGQIMVSLDILCVSIDLRVYFLCPVIIQFHPLPPQWRGCHKCTNEESSSIHYRHNGGLMPERLTWAGQIMVSLDIFCVFPSISVLMSCYHPVPSITATMEGMPERHTWFHQLPGDARKAHVKHQVPSISATMEEMPERHMLAGQIMVSLDILSVSIDLRVYFLCPVIIQFHPLPPQWRRCQKGTREASSSIHYRHNGGDA